MLENSLFNKVTEDKLLSSLKNQVTFVYGAGNTGRDVYNILKENDYQVSGFIDGQRFNTVVENAKVYHLEDIKNRFNDYKNDNVIVAIFNRDVDIGKIIAQLKSIGFNNVFTFIEFFQYFEEALQERFWLSNSQLLIDEQEKIQQVYSLLVDEESRKVFESLVKFRISCDYNELREPLGLEQQYFPEDIDYWTEQAHFIDAGAYDGDTVRWAIEKNKKLASVFCLEPEITTYKKLVFSNSQLKETQAYQIPCGLWRESTVLRFNSSQGEGSHISDTGDNSITVVALDDVIANTAPTQIKMDIEGAELDALAGAEQTLRKYQPNLAICVYHKPKDLWEIPLYIHALNLNYRFYLRNYGYSMFETVLYAIQ